MQLFSKNSRRLFPHGLENQIKIAKASHEPWKDYTLSEKKRRIALGNSCVWFYEKKDDLWIYQWNGTEYNTEVPENPDEDSWQRWGLDPKYKGLSLRPVMAPKPHLVVPEYPLIIAPKVKIKIYVQTPIWVQMFLRSEKRTTNIYEYPTLKLSKTWFGTSMSGEPCYSLKTSAIRNEEELEKKDCHAVSPVIIRNASLDDLMIEKICLRGDSFDLYQGDDRIWTSETVITYRGKHKQSKVTIKENTPSEVINSTPIGLPRVPHEKSFIARTFSQLKHITQLDL